MTSDFAIETHQFFNRYRKLFGNVHMRKLFGVSDPTLYKWAADPDFNAETRPNPLDKLEAMLTNLVEAKERDLALNLIDRLARIADAKITTVSVTPDKDTIEAECLDDLPVVAAFHQALIEKRPVQEIRDHHRRALQELDENLALYEQQYKD